MPWLLVVSAWRLLTPLYLSLLTSLRVESPKVEGRREAMPHRHDLATPRGVAPVRKEWLRPCSHLPLSSLGAARLPISLARFRAMWTRAPVRAACANTQELGSVWSSTKQGVAAISSYIPCSVVQQRRLAAAAVSPCRGGTDATITRSGGSRDSPTLKGPVFPSETTPGRGPETAQNVAALQYMLSFGCQSATSS